MINRLISLESPDFTFCYNSFFFDTMNSKHNQHRMSGNERNTRCTARGRKGRASAVQAESVIVLGL